MNVPRISPLKQIRRNCLECCGGRVKSVRFCHSINCSFWFLRFGRYPRTVTKEKGKKWEQLFNKGNFKKGKKFCPDKYVDEYKL